MHHGANIIYKLGLNGLKYETTHIVTQPRLQGRFVSFKDASRQAHASLRIPQFRSPKEAGQAAAEAAHAHDRRK